MISYQSLLLSTIVLNDIYIYRKDQLMLIHLETSCNSSLSSILFTKMIGNFLENAGRKNFEHIRLRPVK